MTTNQKTELAIRAAVRAAMEAANPQPAADPAPDLMTIREACRRLRVSRPTAYRLFARGALRFVKIGKSVRVPRSEVDYIIQNGAPLAAAPNGEA